jgi:hypothetical protein
MSCKVSIKSFFHILFSKYKGCFLMSIYILRHLLSFNKTNDEYLTVMMLTVVIFISNKILFLVNRLHPLLHIVHLLHLDIYIRKVIFEFQVRLLDEIDDVIIRVKLVFVLFKYKNKFRPIFKSNVHTC